MDSVGECGKPGHRRWRPSSLDLNAHGQNMAVPSLHPLSADDAYTKNSCAISICSRSNLFPSPGTPNHWHSGAGVSSYQKGWSPERIALTANRGQRYGANVLMFPFNNGSTMPSKWEDAEKWICSPVASDGLRRPLILPRYQRRPKSKSGSLGTPALTGGACPLALLQFSCSPPGNYIRSEGTYVNLPFIRASLPKIFFTLSLVSFALFLVFLLSSFCRLDIATSEGLILLLRSNPRSSSQFVRTVSPRFVRLLPMVFFLPVRDHCFLSSLPYIHTTTEAFVSSESPVRQSRLALVRNVATRSQTLRDPKSSLFEPNPRPSSSWSSHTTALHSAATQLTPHET